jgi:hypothetical protein
MLLFVRAMYPDVVLTNMNVRIYWQSQSPVTTREVTRLPLTFEEESEEWRLVREAKEKVIEDEGVKYLGLKDFGKERAALFDVRMGGGKTRMIQGALLSGARSLILTHRQTLAADIYSEVHRKKSNGERELYDHPLDWSKDAELKHYDFDYKTTESKAAMGVANKLICQLESISHLAGAAPYKYLMIDESELFFAQAASSCIDKA